MRRRSAKEYLNALQGLYSDKVSTTLQHRKKTSPREKLCPSEYHEQVKLVDWMRVAGVPHHHSPNGGYRNKVEAMKFKRMGTNAGFPDIFIPIARKGFHGLTIELKRILGGKLTESQLAWRDIFVEQGYAWYEAKGSDEAIKIIEGYLKN